MVIKKKTFIFSVLTLLSLNLISCNAVSESTSTEKDIKFYAEDAQTLETITIDEKSNELLLGANINKSIYSEKLNKYIILDNDRNLFTLDSNGAKEEISSYVDNIEDINAYSTTIYYITSKGELYERVKDSTTNTLVDKNIQSYGYLNNDLIYYLNNESDLYLKKDNEESFKIANNVSDFFISPDTNTIVYTSNKTAYVYNLSSENKEVLANNCDDLNVEFINNDDFIYLMNTITYGKPGSLFYKVKDSNPICLADDAFSMVISPNKEKIYYLNSKSQVYCSTLKSQKIIESNLIIEDVLFLQHATNNDLFIVDYNRTVIKVDSKGKEEELAWEVRHSIPYLDTMVSNSEGTLFIGNEKLDNDLYHFMVFEDNLVYLKSNGQVFLKEPNKEPQLILDDFNDYLNIYFNDERVFVNLLDLNFLTGYWIQEDTTYGLSMMEINEDIFTQVSKYSMRKFDIGVNSLKYNEIELYLDGIREQTRTIKKIDKDTIDLATVKYIRSDKETYDAFVKQIQETGLNFNDYQ